MVIMASVSIVSIFLVLFASMIGRVHAHGRLLSPTTRVGHTQYENDPVVGNNRGDSWVCRHADANPSVQKPTYQAGGVIEDVKWVTTAAHVGDCAMYLSYDFQGVARSDMKFFKIANIPDCKAFSGQNYPIQLPDWLPGGDAVLRWSWYALHNSPPEFFVQCADIKIQPSANAIAITDVYPRYSMIDPPVYPDSRMGSTSETGYRDPYGDGATQGQPGWFLTGPPCANGFSSNNCDLTKNNKNGVYAQTPPLPPALPSPQPSPPAPQGAPATSPSPQVEGSNCVPTAAYAPYDGYDTYCADPVRQCPSPQCEFKNLVITSPPPSTSPPPALTPQLAPPPGTSAVDSLISCVSACLEDAAPMESDGYGRRLELDLTKHNATAPITSAHVVLTGILAGVAGAILGAAIAARLVKREHSEKASVMFTNA